MTEQQIQNRKAYNRAYYLKNQDKVLERVRLYYIKNRKSILKRQKAYNALHREQAAAWRESIKLQQEKHGK